MPSGGHVLATVYGGTGLDSPGADGNVLTSNGTDWVSAPPISGAPSDEVAFTSSQGNWTLAHGLSYSPTTAIITLTALGQVVFQAALRWDATNFYLTGSDAGITGFIEVWK